LDLAASDSSDSEVFLTGLVEERFDVVLDRLDGVDVVVEERLKNTLSSSGENSTFESTRRFCGTCRPPHASHMVSPRRPRLIRSSAFSSRADCATWVTASSVRPRRLLR